MSLIETGEEVKFARSLVNPDKSLRDQTLQSLNKYAAALQRIDDAEMLKLWKGLYYCMWLSDKQEIQFELATALANLIDKFRNQTVVFQYIRLFFRTILREWFSLDQYRVNKFYTLIRLFLNRSLNLAFKAKWSADVTNEILSILKQEVFAKTPNGIRFHIADIFVHELWSVTDGSITVKNFMTLIQPFIEVLVTNGNDSIFIERVQKEVFLKFLDENAGQNESADDSEEGSNHSKLFSCDITLAVQKQLFDLASEESTSESARRRLYALHKSYGAKSGIPFVSEDDIKNAKKTVGVKPVSRPVEGLKVAAPAAAAVEPVVTDSKTKTNKKKRTSSDVEAPVAAEEESVKKVTKTDDKKKPSKKSEEKQEEKKEEEEVVTKSSNKKSKTSSEPAVEEKESAPVAKATKDKKAAAAPTPAAAAEEEGDKPKSKKLKSILSTSSEAATPAAQPEFIASKKFDGAKPGYAFHNVSLLIFVCFD